MMRRLVPVILAIALALTSQAQAQAQNFVVPVAPNPTAIAPPAAQSDAEKPLALDARALMLGGALQTPQLWQAYKTRFITDTGRVIDTGNGLVSHSEGQGYAMVLAVAANDRAAFDLIWGWTRANLMVRDDQLLAWRWDPARRPAIADMNDASDGDILVAWALTEGAELWGDMALRTAGRRIAVEVGRKLVLYKTKRGAILLPAVAGFSASDRTDGPVVNVSYWVFPALARLSLVAPEIDWRGITQAGMDIVKLARFGTSRLPTEWVSLRNGEAKPADGFPSEFGYNAVRVPLYLAWAGIGERQHYSAFETWATRSRGAGALVEITSGRERSFGEPGYGAVAALTLCVTQNQPLDASTFTFRQDENYYPATLRLLSVLAAQMRYPSCVRS